MVKINWDEFKEYKVHNPNRENFDLVISFMRSYYNMTSPMDMYDSLAVDGLGQMLLEKKDIRSVEDLEDYIYQSR